MINTRIQKLQQYLIDQNIDAYIAYDFRGSNPIARSVCGISENIHTTRRFALIVPARGTPVAIVHAIEPHVLDHLHPEKKIYFRSEEWKNKLQDSLKGIKIAALEYSPLGEIPYVSLVDAGLVDLIRSFGIDVVSSENVVQSLICTLTPVQYTFWKEALNVLSEAYEHCWDRVRTAHRSSKKLSEWELATEVEAIFKKHGCICDGGPIIAVNAHAADPHYHPSKESSSLISPGDLLLVDIFCKKDCEDGIYADLCKVAFCGKHPPEKIQTVFQIVSTAQKTAFVLLQSPGLHQAKAIDRSARNVIEKEGFGPYFTHRLGHNIYKTGHGPGPHLDDIETHDSRLLLPGTCFSVEPGIYLPGEFGIRLENDVYLHTDGSVEIEGGIEENIRLLY